MKYGGFFALMLALLGFSCIGGYQFWVAQQQREELARLQQRAGLLATEVAAAQRRLTNVRSELEQAEQQAAQLLPREGVVPSDSRSAEVKAWLLRVKRLQALFEQRPDQRIPEMALLKDLDWLRTARDANLNTDDGVRKALAAARSDAAIKFGNEAAMPALRKFAKSAAADGAAPNVFALAGYFDPPVDATTLARYELLQRPRHDTDAAYDWMLRTKAPIDPDYDSRVELTAGTKAGYGMSSTSGPMAWMPELRQQVDDAYSAFRALNNGAPPRGIADVLPFFNPPLDPAVAEKLLEAERDRSR